MERLSRGYCFEDSEGASYLIVGDAVNRKDGQIVYLCQELTGTHRLMIWTIQEILGDSVIQEEETAAAWNHSYTAADPGYSDRDFSLTKEYSMDRNTSKSEEELLQSMMIRFLEASPCSEKLELLDMMKGKVTESMLESMAISMDYELGGGSVEEKYYALERFLKTRNRYEGTRLR